MKRLGAALAIAGACAVALGPAEARRRPVEKSASQVTSPRDGGATRGAKKRAAAPARARVPVPFPRSREGIASTLPEVVPFPPARPVASAAPASPPVPPVATSPAPAAVAPPAPPAADPAQLAACYGRLTAAKAEFHPVPAITGNGGCGASDAVRLQAVVVDNRERITLTPPAIVRCGMAEAIVNWVEQDLVPLTRAAERKLTDVAVAGSYECRGRNRVVGARLSQHGTANAIDVSALSFGSGTPLGLTDAKADKAIRERLRQSACARFTTVLGPGSDGAHETHIHLDVIERRGGYRICQWDIR